MVAGSARRRWFSRTSPGGSPARRAARQAGRSPVMTGLARAGLAARGVMYVLIGVIAVQVAFGDSGRQADRSGALRLVASTPFGTVVLWLLVIGFAGMALWRLSQAIWGSGAGQDGRKASKRLAAGARAIFYGVVTFSILKYALGLGAPSSSDKQSRDLTATALHYPGGQVVVVLAGLGFIGGGGYLAFRAFRKKFLRHLRMGSASAALQKVVTRLGQAGGIARGAVFATAGVFLVVAGLQYRPHQAKGIDSALRALARTPLGPWLLAAVAAGLVLFGIYSWCEARWREV
jgi:Domain of Unknown Function (DUF1206)